MNSLARARYRAARGGVRCCRAARSIARASASAPKTSPSRFSSPRSTRRRWKTRACASSGSSTSARRRSRWPRCERGNIDCYPEYTGTALIDVLASRADRRRARGLRSRRATLRAALRHRLAAAVADERLARARNDAGDRGDIVILRRSPTSPRAAPRLRLATIQEFLARPDGLPGLQRDYGGFAVRLEVRTYDIALKYRALLDGEADIASAFTTDGAIAADRLWSFCATTGISGRPITSRRSFDAATLHGAPRDRAASSTRSRRQSPIARRAAMNARSRAPQQDPADVAAAFLKSLRGRRRSLKPASIAFDEVGVRYPGADRNAVDGVSFEFGGGELVVLLGPVGLRQVDAAAHGQPARASRSRAASSLDGTRRRRARSGAAAPQHRLRDSSHRPLRAYERRAEHRRRSVAARLEAAGDRAARRRAARRSSGSTRRAIATAVRAGSPAARRSASASRAPSRRGRARC